MKQVFIIILLASLIGCTSTELPSSTEPQDPSSLFNHSLFNEQAVIPEADIFLLPTAEQVQFHAYHQDALTKGVREDRIIANYLNTKLNEFTYDGATLSAAQTLVQDEGNCISLAILTQAYANLIDVETSFREVASIPVYKKTERTLLVSNHFKTKLFAPDDNPEGWISAIRPGTVIDYFPAQDIYFVSTATVDDLTAKFYANLATNELLNEQFDKSYSYLKQAFKHKKTDPELINLAAILHRRAGDADTAKRLFEYAIQHSLISSNLLSSYTYLAAELNDMILVKKLEAMSEASAKTPFDIINIARKAFMNQHYTRAEKLLSELVQEFPYLPEPYFELAKLHYQKNNLSTSQHFLSEALLKAEDQKKAGIYQAKLSSLEQLLSKR
ncbi:tetratricopeptide repeat protein [Pseudoalteromonas aurantia]|uniref:Tetratricopeptide repeat protein 21A/21B second ARM domain-containing protein n=1 Tax=Pseudoalteromonas aurantia 208 TaxID=1314867 RepID=A0ABR9EG74_9GAMM|nr:hypothetical protein [Pseudoalteromonas aurantia]MBE0369909.1 hypothetical protein [Pseudoalteromonas aurantia 208]